MSAESMKIFMLHVCGLASAAVKAGAPRRHADPRFARWIGARFAAGRDLALNCPRRSAVEASMRGFAPAVLIAVVTATAATHLHAQPPKRYDARTERLQGLTRPDLAQLEPQLQTGVVGLIEFADTEADHLPGINVAAIVHAPASAVVALIKKPEAYPNFMRTLDHVELVHRDARATVYDWRWQMSLLSLGGRNAMTVYEPPPSRPESGYRVTIDSQSGDFGKGRISLRVLPRGAQESLLVISMRLDLRTANYVARQLAQAARSINRSANMSLAYTMLLSFRREAEQRAGYAAPARSAVALHKPELATGPLLPLLSRGDLVLLDMSGDRLNQIAVLGLIPRARALVREVMLDTDAFGSALMPGSEATVVEKRANVTTFDWDIDLPFVGVSGRMRMREGDPVVAVDAVDGALQGGRWNFETLELSREATMITGWASFDLRNSSWFLRALTDADPYLGHGMSAASQVMLMRALRSRTNKRAEGK
jgi:hypothetical protein